LGSVKLLGPDVISLVVEVAFGGVDPVLALGFDVFREVRIVGEPRTDEVGIRRHTYLFSSSMMIP